jgi:AcrR family transcriptional regulator
MSGFPSGRSIVDALLHALTRCSISTMLSKKAIAMPKLVDAVVQRREIRRAAQRVFSRRGVKGTGLAHVAAEAGMARSSLYHYYPDKDTLVRDLLNELLAHEEALFAAVVGGDGSPLVRIERLIGALVESFEAWSAVGRVLFDLRASQTRRFRPFFRRLRQHLAATVVEGQRCGEIDASLDPELAASAVIGLVDGLLLQYFVDRSAFADTAALADALTTNVRKGLLP